MLWGIVQASQRTTTYNVTVEFSPSKIQSALCSCPVGQYGLCHHIAAVLDYTARNISCTDTVCQWSFKAKAGHGNESLPIDELYPASKPSYQAIPCPLSPEEVKEARSNLCRCMGGAAGVKWLTDPEPQADAGSTTSRVEESSLNINIPSIEKVVLSPGFLEAEDKLDYCATYFNLSADDIVSIAEGTKGQSGNPLWFELRRHRITGSIFGKVIKGAVSGRPCTSLISQISGRSRFLEGVRAIDWGCNHEAAAVTEFSRKFPGKEVLETGMWLDRYGIVGASPDRLRDKDELIEVKCPYSMRDVTDLEKELALKKHEKYFITYNLEGEGFMENKHEYYHQIQGQLHLTGRSLCYFVMWCPRDTLIVQVPKDCEWAKTSDVLTTVV